MFLYASNEQLEPEVRTKQNNTIHNRSIVKKNLDISLTKYVQGLYVEN